MIKKFINFLIGDKSKRLVEKANSILSVFDKTLKELATSNGEMEKHQSVLDAEIKLKQAAHATLEENITKNRNVIANIEKFFASATA